ncbi:hypothetical protein GTP45_02605 [Pseudoduganella sp. FT55W]|uniref:Uncharacterized protein n=1 Tax=Duganella rivi TaxID=2666083 RepID=A0A7X4KAX3_9BURK|nr:hypothetical protein [Duganella rivi]MYM65723.1 hypothetical protein [Duganella rivi]
MPKLGDALSNLSVSDFTIDEFGRLIIHNTDVIDAVVAQVPAIKNPALGASNNCNCPGSGFTTPDIIRNNPGNIGQR